MIHIFAQCGAHIVKFQKRCPRELLAREKYDEPHPNPNQSYGPSYGAHREFLELDINQHAILKKECERLGIEYMASVWDMTSAREIMSLNPNQIKIPSPVNNNRELLDLVCGQFKGMIHISTGMTTIEELKIISEYIAKVPDQFVLYHSVSSYPTHISDLCLKNIAALRQYCERIGFSGHHNGIDADIAAAVYGASYLERHVTLSTMLKGTDHKFSLEPDQFRELICKVNRLQPALNEKKQGVLECEKQYRDKLKRTV